MSVARRSALAPVALLVGVAVLMLAPAALAKTPKQIAACETSGESITALIEAEESVPTELSSPLEAGILSRFAVLRRVALASDQIPALSPGWQESISELLQAAEAPTAPPVPAGPAWPGFRPLRVTAVVAETVAFGLLKFG